MLQQELTHISQIPNITFIETFQNVDEMPFYVGDCRQAHALLTFHVHKLRFQPVHTHSFEGFFLSQHLGLILFQRWMLTGFVTIIVLVFILKLPEKRSTNLLNISEENLKLLSQVWKSAHTSVRVQKQAGNLTMVSVCSIYHNQISCLDRVSPQLRWCDSVHRGSSLTSSLIAAP